MLKYSFIIPVVQINDHVRESVSKILEINRDDYEIIIYSDEAGDEADDTLWPKTRQIATGHIGPAQKRNLATKDARGEILIFIDDDAYPQKDFLDILDKDFSAQIQNINGSNVSGANILAIGGPAITPPTDSFWQKVSGAVFLSALSGGFPERYTPVGAKRYINDWPSVNLSIRLSAFRQINGFNCSYWPGEDTKLCLDVVQKLKGKILYDPALIVCHHRRAGLYAHLKQIGGYGLHRGFFAKKFPQTSFKLKYFIPSLFLLFIFVGAILVSMSAIVLSSFFSTTTATTTVITTANIFIKLYLFGWVLYILALLKSLLDIRKHEKNILVALCALYYIFFTHLYYGWRFLQGYIFTRELKSKLR